MSQLSPEQAARIASGVYTLFDFGVEDALKTGGLGIDGLFAVDRRSVFKARTGMFMIRKLTDFGYVAAGVEAFEGSALVATRGTRMAWDWVTDVNIALQRGPGGWPVHAGFNETWKSYARSLSEFFDQHRVERVHCVGHSLGGALAALNADWCTSRGLAAELYTFGAPRTGDALFARSLTRRLQPAHIHRVSHPADPVPMIPLFPFWHLPHGERGLTIPQGDFGLVHKGAHSMAETYLPAMTGKDWGALAVVQRADENAQVQGWLERAAAGQGGFVQGSARLLSMIGRALAWLLKGALKVVAHGVSAAATASLTALDLVACLLANAAALAKEVAAHVKTLAAAILSFLGRKVGQGVDVTVAFLRWVLALLGSTLAGVARRALDLVA